MPVVRHVLEPRIEIGATRWHLYVALPSAHE
jgi:hypothetical protein